MPRKPFRYVVEEQGEPMAVFVAERNRSLAVAARYEAKSGKDR